MIIVTGGAGFIGSNIVKGLNDRGCSDILIVDELGNDEKYKNLIGLRYADYQQKDDFLRYVREGKYRRTAIEAIFHQGACSDTMEYDCNFVMANNYEYTKELFHFCVDRRIPYLYASSASTYGAGQHGFREAEACEGALNPYAFSKLSFDRYLRRYLSSLPSPVIGLKYFNVFGPQENHKGKMASVAFHFYNQLKQTGVVKLFKGVEGYGNGEQKRDFIYVRDVVKVNLHFFEKGGPSGIYNCGTGCSRTFNDVANSVIRYFGKGSIGYIDFPEVLKGKYQSYTQADTAKLREAGYQDEFYSLEDAVSEYCKILDESNGYFRL